MTPKKRVRKQAIKKRRAQFSEIVDAPGPLYTRLHVEALILSWDDWRARKWPAVNVLTDLQGSAAEQTAQVEIEGCLSHHKEYGSPLHLFQAFTAAIQVGVYPPVIVLQAMAVAFQKYQDAKGGLTLDQAFRSSKQGGRKLHGEENTRVMTKFVATLLYQGKLYRDRSTAEAAELVHYALKHHRSLNLSYEVDSLIRQYPAWKKRFKLDETDTTNLDHPDNPLMPWDDAHRKRFLAPPDYSLF